MLANALLALISFLLGSFVTWVISRHYYLKAAGDQHQLPVAIKLQNTTELGWANIVALYEKPEGIPLYSLLTVKWSDKTGRAGIFATNACVVFNDLQRLTLLEVLLEPPKDTCFRLNAMGQEAALYLSNNHGISATFDEITPAPHLKRGVPGTPILNSPHSQDA